MLLTIHNLPSHMQYANVRLLIQKECGIKSDELILDNLVSEGRLKKVTVGLTGEKQAEILIRKLNGMTMEGHRLYVKDLAQKKTKETTNSSSNNQIKSTPPQQSQSYESQAQQSPQGFYPMNVPIPSNYGYANQPYMPLANELIMPTLMNPPMMGMGGVPPQNSYMGYGGQVQSAHDPQQPYYSQQEQTVDSPKNIKERAGTKKYERTVTKTQWGRNNSDFNDRYQNEGDNDDMGGSRNYDRATNRRSRSGGRDDNSRFREERNRNYNTNKAKRSPGSKDRDRSQGNYYQSARDSRRRSRSPHYEERGRMVSRDRYQDNGRPDDSYRRKDSDDAVANPSHQYGGGDNYDSQGYNYDEMDKPQTERNNPMSSDRGSQSSGNHWDKPNNPSPQNRGPQGYRWDESNNPLPQNKGNQPQGNRWNEPNDPLPQTRGAQGYCWDEPNNPSPQNRGPQGNRWYESNNPLSQNRGPPGNRWDELNNPLPETRGPQGNRWDEPNNPMPQSRGVQPPGNHWDEPNDPFPQSRGPQQNRWNRLNNPLPQTGGVKSPGNRLNEPNNPMPQSREFQPPGNRWDELNNSLPQYRGRQGNRRDKPNNPLPQSTGVQPGSVQAREREQSASPKKSSPPLFWEDRKPNSVEANIPPLMRNVVPPPAKKAAPQSQETTKAIKAEPKIKQKDVTPAMGIDTLKRDTAWRKTVASKIGGEILKQLPHQRHRRQVLIAVRDAIFVRIDLILQDELVPFKEISRRYRQRFPESTDRELLEVVYEKVTNKPLGDAPQTVNSTSADQSSDASTTAASTSATTSGAPVKKITKVEIPADKVTLYEYTANDTVATLISEKAVDLDAENKKIQLEEFENGNVYGVDATLSLALDAELTPVVNIFVNELNQEQSAEEAQICHIMARQVVNFRKCLNMHVTKRVLDIRTSLLLRVFVNGKPPKQPDLEKLLKEYGVVTLKKSNKNGPLYYVAECSTYEGYDELRSIQIFQLDTATLVIKPYHDAGPPKKAPRKWRNGVKQRPMKKKKRK